MPDGWTLESPQEAHAPQRSDDVSAARHGDNLAPVAISAGG
ncbi:MAG TPA: hypothetical protein VFN04_07435 [Protaetiibacter sp.]|jgi:hypothetical protein|nr:hypothetical protein [Protaetiibacter sp.]